jgi:hypothetical protein
MTSPIPAPGLPTIVPKVGIGDWDPCFKPGPCPCPNPCTWVAQLAPAKPQPDRDGILYNIAVAWLRARDECGPPD